jgi:hypothetical protein
MPAWIGCIPVLKDGKQMLCPQVDQATGHLMWIETSGQSLYPSHGGTRVFCDFLEPCAIQ